MNFLKYLLLSMPFVIVFICRYFFIDVLYYEWIVAVILATSTVGLIIWKPELRMRVLCLPVGLYGAYMVALLVSYQFNTAHSSLHYNPLLTQAAGFAVFLFILYWFKSKDIPSMILLIVAITVAYVTWHYINHGVEIVVWKNPLGMWWAIVACLAIHLVEIKKWRVFSMIAIVYLSIGCILVGSRGAVTGLIISYTIYSVMRKQRIASILPLMIMIIAIIPFKENNVLRVTLGYYQDFLTIGNKKIVDPTGTRLSQILPHSMPMIIKSFPVGIGIGNGIYAEHGYNQAMGSHNYMVELWTYGGIPSLGLWLVLVIMALISSAPLPVKMAVSVYVWYGWWDSQAAGTATTLILFSILLAICSIYNNQKKGI